MIRQDWSTLRKLMFAKTAAAGTAVTEATATGNPLTFLTDLAKPLKSLLIPFSPKQSGTGDPAPENIRPILPWDGLTVRQGGRNLFDGEYPEIVPAPLYYRAIYVGNEAVTVSSDIVKTGTSNYSNLFALAGNVSTGAATGINDVREGVSRTITPINGYITLAYRSFEDVDPRNYHTQIEVGNTATPYEPYKPITEHSATFASTVYGGTLDMVTGELKVKKAYALLNDVDKWTQLTAGQTVDFSYEQDFERKLYDGSLTGLVCSAFLAVVNQNVAYCRWRGATSLKFGIKNGNSMATPLTLEDVKQMATDGEIAICYDIEPQTVTLTGEQITAIKGQNTLWSDGDSMTAVYLKKA